MISVIIPTYRTGKYLYEALESALIQSVNEEILVIDDCSEDNVPGELLKYFEDKYGRIDCFDSKMAVKKFTDETDIAVSEGTEISVSDIVGKRKQALEKTRLCYQFVVNDTMVSIFQNRTNLGVAVARNIGTVLAAGEYVAFLDADDVWAKDKLSKQVSLLDSTGACMCNTSRVLMDKDGKPVGNVINTPERITLKMLEKTNHINCSSVVIKRDIMINYPMKYRNVHEDYYSWLCILKEYDFAVGIDEPLMFYRLSDNGKSRKKMKAAAMTFRTYRYAGYSLPRAVFMMFAYTINGLRKYRLKNIKA